jgi:hypothetical protein
MISHYITTESYYHDQKPITKLYGANMAKLKYKINPKYQNSRPVNYNRWSNHKEVDALVAEIMADFSASRKKSGYMINMKVLVLDLFESYCADPEQYIGCHRNNNRFKFKLKSGTIDRYIKNPHISVDYFVGAVDHLRANKYVEYSKGGHFEDEQRIDQKYVSRIRPTIKFAEICSRYKLTLDMVRKFSEDELIILKNEKKKIKDPKSGRLVQDPNSGIPIGYEDTAETIRMRKIVRLYNLLMDNTYIDIDVECLSDADKEKMLEKLRDYDVENPEIIIRLANRNVYRVFNNGDTKFRQGGRFYGSWWIGCPSTLRKYITIDGSPTVELDYSGIHIHLAYALEGINYASLKQKPYELIDNDPERELNKLILLTAINAIGTHLTASSVFNELRKNGELGKYGIWSHEPIKQKLELLKLKHKPIIDYIASGKGIFLQYYDSLVIEQLISYFTNRRIPILTIHDSVICKQEHSSIVKDKMFELFVNMINTKLRADVVKKSAKGNIPRLLHIKYQKQVRKIPNWQQLITDNKVKYNQPNRLIINEFNNNIKISKNVIDYFLRVDDLINIKTDKRTNKCSCRCNTSKRHNNYIINRGLYVGNIRIKLIKNENCSYLSINI